MYLLPIREGGEEQVVALDVLNTRTIKGGDKSGVLVAR